MISIGAARLSTGSANASAKEVKSRCGVLCVCIGGGGEGG